MKKKLNSERLFYSSWENRTTNSDEKNEYNIKTEKIIPGMFFEGMQVSLIRLP